ncbi:MAG: aldehyde-activating protein [Alphaproteobacteria bacterium HGW-Alphaproteobacteria-6]|nr:MAG: aldehyde-activating protein [Alphaproteobacteria bacterium HGW-Alphaproteobacteria-6]
MTGPAIHHGSCLCGAVAFEATGPLRDIIACHCSQCRKTSGHVWAATSVPLDRLRITTDAGLGWLSSSAKARRGFCRSCGSSLFWQPEGEERMAIAAGAFDGDPGFRLIRHVFTADKGAYYAIGDGMPQAPGW